jgi:hypothetical protein
MDVYKELEETLRASVLKRFPAITEATLKKVRVWADEKLDGCVTTNAAFLVAKETNKPLSEAALWVAAGWVADDKRLGDARCFLGGGAIVEIKSKKSKK